MSAYITHPATVDLILSAAPDAVVDRLILDLFGRTTLTADNEGRSAVGRYLISVNVRSVQYLYANQTLKDLPGYQYRDLERSVGAYIFCPTSPGYEYRPVTWATRVLGGGRGYGDGPDHNDEARRLLGAIGCYRYQSCEHPEWTGSPAHKFLDELIGRLASHLSVGWEYVGVNDMAEAVSA